MNEIIGLLIASIMMYSFAWFQAYMFWGKKLPKEQRQFWKK